MTKEMISHSRPIITNQQTSTSKSDLSSLYTPYSIIQLQQTVGNRAIGQMINNRKSIENTIQRAVFIPMGLSEDAIKSRKDPSNTNSTSNYGNIKFTKADGEKGSKEAYSGVGGHTEERLIDKLKSEENFTNREIKTNAPDALSVNKIDAIYSEREPCHTTYNDAERRKRIETDKECHNYLERVLHENTPVYFSAEFNADSDQFNNYHNRVKAIVYYETVLEPFYEREIVRFEKDIVANGDTIRNYLNSEMGKLKRLFKDPVGNVDVKQEWRDTTVNTIKRFMFQEMKKIAVVRFFEEFDEKYKYDAMYKHKRKYSTELNHRLNSISSGGKFDNLIFVTNIIKEYKKNMQIIEAEQNKQDQEYLTDLTAYETVMNL